MWPMLQRLSPLSKNSVIGILVTINVLAIAYILVSRDATKRALAMYDHPAIVHDVKIQRVQGPVRIVEKIVERSGGEKVTERTITRDPVVTTSDASSSSTPIAPAVSSRPRYLLGGSWRLSVADRNNGTLWAGYSFWDRVDLLGGVGVDQDRIEARVMVLTRWGH